MNIVVFDIGGTEIKYGIILNGILQDKHIIDTEGHLGAKFVMDKLVSITIGYKEKYPIDGVGISTRK